MEEKPRMLREYITGRPTVVWGVREGVLESTLELKGAGKGDQAGPGASQAQETA